MWIVIVVIALITFVLVCNKFENQLVPPFSWFYKAWMKFSHILGRIMSWILLTILWIVGFGIYGIVMKLVKLFKPKPHRVATYWIESEPHSVQQMSRQF